jgi:biotin carboxyl carrier protein
MRTYLISSDGTEHVVDLACTTRHSSEMVEFGFVTVGQDAEVKDKQRVFIRQLAGSYYSSLDGKKWNKIARQNLPNRLLNVNHVYDLYRGYKPSGLSNAGDGELLTKMPGKVVKLEVAVGDQVEQGDTVIVIEAMKMENEIKAPASGIVKLIHVKEGEALDKGVIMMELE